MEPSKQLPVTPVRLPPDLKEWAKARSCQFPIAECGDCRDLIGCAELGRSKKTELGRHLGGRLAGQPP